MVSDFTCPSEIRCFYPNFDRWFQRFPRPCTGRKGSENHPSARLFVLQKEYGFSMMAGVCYSVNTEKSKLKYRLVPHVDKAPLPLRI